MNKLFVILLILLAISCRSKPDPEISYIDMDLRIVLINSQSILSQNKFHKPQLCNIVLFETLTTDPKLYFEYNNCDIDFRSILINTKWLYNHCPGDTVHFNYIKKSRFFTIKPELIPK